MFSFLGDYHFNVYIALKHLKENLLAIGLKRKILSVLHQILYRTVNFDQLYFFSTTLQKQTIKILLSQ